MPTLFEYQNGLDYKTLLSDLEFKKAANYIDFIAQKVSSKEISTKTAGERIDRYFSTLARGKTLTTKFDLTKAFTQRISSFVDSKIANFSKTILVAVGKPADLLIWSGSWNKAAVAKVAEASGKLTFAGVGKALAKLSPWGLALSVLADLATPIVESPERTPAQLAEDLKNVENNPEVEARLVTHTAFPPAPATPTPTPAKTQTIASPKKTPVKPVVTQAKATIQTMENIKTQITKVITDLSATLESRLTYKLAYQLTAQTTAGKRTKGPYLKLTLYFEPANKNPKILTSYILGSIPAGWSVWQKVKEGKISDLLNLTQEEAAALPIETTQEQKPAATGKPTGVPPPIPPTVQPVAPISTPVAPAAGQRVKTLIQIWPNGRQDQYEIPQDAESYQSSLDLYAKEVSQAGGSYKLIYFTAQDPYAGVRAVFGPNWVPAPIFIQKGLVNQGIYGAVNIAGGIDVYTIGPGGMKETPASYLAKFGTYSQQGIVGTVTPDQARRLGINI